MAKKKKKARRTHRGQFKKGQSGNPGGRPKLPEDIKQARRMNQQEFERIVNKYLYSTKEDLTNASHDPATPALDLMVIRIIMKAVVHGDEKRLGFLKDHLIGKMTTPVSLTGTLADFVSKAVNGEDL